MNAVYEAVKWLFSGIGVVSLLYFLNLLHGFRARFGKPQLKLQKYTGHYESYHFHSIKNDHVVRSNLYITTTAFGHLKAAMHSFQFKYRGTVSFKSGNMFLLLTGDGHEELMLHVLSEPLAEHFDILTGVYSAITDHGTPGAGKIVFRKTSARRECELIPSKKCDKKILEFLQRDIANPLVVRKPDIPLFDQL